MIYGNVIKNTSKGIYGIYTDNISNYQTMEVGNMDSLKIGPALIYTVLEKMKLNHMKYILMVLSKITVLRIFILKLPVKN